ncbi:MAG TPA: hypothetical protein VJ570_09135 [Holophagaceae bacterium]|nr:hypothetical protein [Holophagaceae bacterium]
MAGHPFRPRARSLLLVALALAGCAPPELEVAEPAFLPAGKFAFLHAGRTTREEVLLRLGTPSAHLEGERLLCYAFGVTPDGTWYRRGRAWIRTDPEGPRPVYLGETHSLVLVFDPGGVLVRHSLVVPR